MFFYLLCLLNRCFIELQGIYSRIHNYIHGFIKMRMVATSVISFSAIPHLNVNFLYENVENDEKDHEFHRIIVMQIIVNKRGLWKKNLNYEQLSFLNRITRISRIFIWFYLVCGCCNWRGLVVIFLFLVEKEDIIFVYYHNFKKTFDLIFWNWF